MNHCFSFFGTTAEEEKQKEWLRQCYMNDSEIDKKLHRIRPPYDEPCRIQYIASVILGCSNVIPALSAVKKGSKLINTVR